MTVMHRIYGALAVIGLAAPAAAQDSQSIADAVQQALREARAEVRAAAQAGRGAAARAAAQAEREAERRRRQEARQGPEITEQFSKTARLGRTGTFSLENVSGDITITGGSANDVRIEATKRVRYPNESEARAILQALTINVAERDGSVDVRTEYSGRRRNWSGSVDYMVTVPRDASVSLRSISGGVKVTNVNGELRAESISGGIVTTGVRKIRTLKSTSGEVQISDSESDDLIAGTISGSLIMRNVRARIASLSSVSGDVRLTDVDADHVEMRSVSGNLEYAGRLSRSGRYELQTHSGDVRVTPVGTQSFSLEATTFSGDVRSDFPLTVQGPPSNGFARRRNSVRGTFGSGGAMLTLQSFSGNIVIVKQ